MTTIEIGTVLPMAMNELQAPGTPTVAEAARHAEELGFESVWVPDMMFGDGTPALEATLTLAAAAAVTTRVKLGFGVLAVPTRPAPWLAAQVATLQHLSGNRLLLGVGIGGFPEAPFWQALGVPSRGRGRVTDTTLDLLPRLLSGEPVEIAEGTWPLTIAPSAPMPPVLVGGSERAFTRIVERGDGWCPSLVSPEEIAPAIRRLRDLASERGRPAPSVSMGGHLIIGEDGSARTAYDALVRSLVKDHGMTPEKAARAPMVARSPEELAELFAAYREAGVDRVSAAADNVDWLTQARFVAEARALLN